MTTVDLIRVNMTAHETRAVLFVNKKIHALHVQRHNRQALQGIYKGRVRRLLPALNAAFIDIGRSRLAFLSQKDARVPLRVHDEILVQVSKESLGQKGMRLTMAYHLIGRYLILTPHVPALRCSQKIRDATLRERLMASLTVSAPHGMILRTAAVNATPALLQAEQKQLENTWQTVFAAAQTAAVGTQLYSELPLALRCLRDMAADTTTYIEVDHAQTYQQMREYAARVAPFLVDRIIYYDGKLPLFDLDNVESAWTAALQRSVCLPGGGHVVFDQTEAMVTIDVNTGATPAKRVPKQNQALMTNLAAVAVIAREVQLRNLGGIIVIDFIDMQDATTRDTVLHALHAALREDSAYTEISELTRLGLVQMTRKRTRESLQNVLCETCPTCERRGVIKSIPTVAYEAIRAVQRAAASLAWQGLRLCVAPEVAAFLDQYEADLAGKLSEQLQKPVKWQADARYAREKYDVLPL